MKILEVLPHTKSGQASGLLSQPWFMLKVISRLLVALLCHFEYLFLDDSLNSFST